MTDLEIVQEAQKQIEAQIYEWQEVIDEVSKYDPAIFQSKQLNSWLAQKAFFERHRNYQGYCALRTPDGFGYPCRSDYDSDSRAPYPCPELVAQANAIMGVTK